MTTLSKGLVLPNNIRHSKACFFLRHYLFIINILSIYLVIIKACHICASLRNILLRVTVLVILPLRVANSAADCTLTSTLHDTA